MRKWGRNRWLLLHVYVYAYGELNSLCFQEVLGFGFQSCERIFVCMFQNYGSMSVYRCMWPTTESWLCLSEGLAVLDCLCGYGFWGHISDSRHVNWGQLMQLESKALSPVGKRQIFEFLVKIRVKVRQVIIGL